ncbi:unnamed protein product [Notodromas monacha]|uniref:Uncharacterized protein n=1 Tax=Notodromas monacha TaxID=399045 RepID=A0A7R9C2B3_9CRUS|nr:unnamed protein product [Notodromas monacha]CAG0924483.1 unnamed protein product [Notodromas monacha]
MHSAPVTCNCLEYYAGENCDVVLPRTAAEGVLTSLRSNLISHLNFELYPSEDVTFVFHNQRWFLNSQVSMTVDNMTKSTDVENMVKRGIIVVSGASGRNITLALKAAHSFENGAKITYDIHCTPGYCQGGICHLNRTSTTSSPPYCECDEHHKGTQCEQRVHDCPLVCSDDSACVWIRDRYTCKCRSQGYTYNGTNCNDVNECESLLNTCSSPEVCVNTPGSFFCTCPTAHQALKTLTRNSCVYSGCSSPWIESRDKICYLMQGHFENPETALDYCESLGATLAETENMNQSEEIGMASKSALVWIGLTDGQAESKWKWINSGAKPGFSNWGPGFPEGSGDFAVLYPNRWTTKSKNCTIKKRFICETTDPFCPFEWIRLENVPRKCFFQSNTVSSFFDAHAKCAEAAVGGKLATWTKETLVNFKPMYWDSSVDEGLAHFWINHLVCNGTYCSPILTTSFNPMLENPYFIEDVYLIHTPMNKTTDLSEISKSCAFLFPNKWADYSHEKSEFTGSPGPAVACQRGTSYTFKGSSDKGENKLKPDVISSDTDDLLTPPHPNSTHILPSRNDSSINPDHTTNLDNLQPIPETTSARTGL